jgi:hypothetical protein
MSVDTEVSAWRLRSYSKKKLIVWVGDECACSLSFARVSAHALLERERESALGQPDKKLYVDTKTDFDYDILLSPRKYLLNMM